MKTQKIIVLELTETEANALKILLGKHSFASKRKLGLTCEQADITRGLYDVICDTISL